MVIKKQQRGDEKRKKEAYSRIFLNSQFGAIKIWVERVFLGCTTMNASSNRSVILRGSGFIGLTFWGILPPLTLVSKMWRKPCIMSVATMTGFEEK